MTASNVCPHLRETFHNPLYCPWCTGQQPAKPGSEEARRHLGTLYVGGSTSHYGSWYSATDYDRLQSALEAAQREIADLRNRLNLSEKLHGRFPVDAVQPDPKEPT